METRDNLRSVLFVAYNSYPSASVGAKRIGKFCKYLPLHDFEPVLLTASEKEYPLKDDRLKVPDLTVYRARSLIAKKPKTKWNVIKLALYYVRRFVERRLFPDAYITWLPFALVKAGTIFKRHEIEVVVASGPSFVSFLTGFFLKRRFKKPLILDFRDQWSLNPCLLANKRARWHQYLDRKMMKAANGMIFTSDGILNEYRVFYPEIDFSKAKVVRNGFDPDDFTRLKAASSGQRFTVTYAGYFYGERTADSFLKALSELEEEGKINRDNFRFVSIGNFDETMLKYRNLEPLVEIRGCLSHADTMSCLAASDLLLVIIANGYESNIPAKIYEYLRITKPIFVIGPERSSVRDIVEDTDCGVIANINRIDEIKSGLHQLSTSNGAKFGGGSARLENYNCLRTTERLACVLSEHC